LRPQEILEIVFSSKGESNKGIQKIQALARESKIETSENNKYVEEISGKQNAYVVAVFRKFEAPIESENSHLVLVNPAGAGNLGTIMRTALAFGVEDIAIIKPAADHFDPKTIRGSMGAIFQIRVTTFESFEIYAKRYPRPLFIFSPDGATEISAVSFSRPAGLVFGTESAGIPDDLKDKGVTVRVEHSKKVDSLNLPISIGIALYSFSKAS
jgi:TrmH family RNA methyltransferase